MEKKFDLIMFNKFISGVVSEEGDVVEAAVGAEVVADVEAVVVVDEEVVKEAVAVADSVITNRQVQTLGRILISPKINIQIIKIKLEAFQSPVTRTIKVPDTAIHLLVMGPIMETKARLVTVIKVLDTEIHLGTVTKLAVMETKDLTMEIKDPKEDIIKEVVIFKCLIID